MKQKNIEDIYELSPLQQGMLFHTLVVPHSGVYFEQFCYALQTQLNVPAFKKAWQRVLDRHPILRTSFYWENFIFFGLGPKRGPDGKLAITLPMGEKKLPSIAAEDIGKCAYGIFKKGPEFIGKTVGITGQHLTGKQMAAAMSKALGQEIGYNAIPPEIYRNFGFPGAEDLANMFQFQHDFNDYFTSIRSENLSKELNPSLQTFDYWLEKNKNRIPID